MVGKVKGRKHYIFLDTIGCVLVALVHTANVHDGKGVWSVLERVFEAVPTLFSCPASPSQENLQEEKF